MARSADAAERAALGKVGFAAGQIVQELGWDQDADDDLRAAIEELIGNDLEDESYADGADAVLLWFRAGDGDLVDVVVDALGNLVDRGTLVLATPRAGEPDHVEPSEIEDAALTAGLHTSGSVNLSPAWLVTRLVAPRSHRK